MLGLPHVNQKLTAGAHIVREGQRANQCCLLISGFAFRYKIAGNGARSIQAFHMGGDFLDLQNALLGEADHSVQTLSAARVAMVARSDLLRLAETHPRVGFAMWYDTLVDGSVFREWITNVARRDAPTRIAHLLCEIGVRMEASGSGERDSFELPVTQDQLADATGLTSVHVNRTLMELERQGLFTRTLRYVAVPDWQRLSDAGDFAHANGWIDGGAHPGDERAHQ